MQDRFPDGWIQSKVACVYIYICCIILLYTYIYIYILFLWIYYHIITTQYVKLLPMTSSQQLTFPVAFHYSLRRFGFDEFSVPKNRRVLINQVLKKTVAYISWWKCLNIQEALERHPQKEVRWPMINRSSGKPAFVSTVGTCEGVSCGYALYVLSGRTALSTGKYHFKWLYSERLNYSLKEKLAAVSSSKTMN